MLRFIAHKISQALLALLIVSALTFALLSAAGGDALTSLQEDPHISAATLEKQRLVYGLNQSLPRRYGNWLSGAVRLQLGDSFAFKLPVSKVLWPRLRSTFLLSAAAIVLAVVLALALALGAALRPRAWLDNLCAGLILLISSTPRIVLALFVLVWATRFGLYNLGGEVRGVYTLRQLFWPALVLALPLAAIFLAQLREGFNKALREDFVRVARAKGLPERSIILRHALPAALNPLITIFGYSLGGLMSGSVVVESVLGWPGLGSLSVEAVRTRDVPLLMGVVLVAAALVLAGNFMAELLLRYNDPRVR